MQNPSESGSVGTETIAEKKAQSSAPEPFQKENKDALEEKKLDIQQKLESSFAAALTNITKEAGLKCDSPEITIVNQDNIGRKFCFRIEASINRSKEEPIPENGHLTVAFIRRTIFYAGEWKVSRTGMSVSPDLQGKGKSIGSQITKAEEEAYRKQGISEIQTRAGPPVGTYFSAREGFDFAKPGVKSQTNAKFLSLVLGQDISDVRLRGSEENLWPLKREFSAYELSQMQVFDRNGNEIQGTAKREKDSNETLEITERFVRLCCPKTTSEKLKTFLRNDEFNQTLRLTKYLTLTSRDERQEEFQHYFKNVLNIENIQIRLKRELGDEGRLEYLNLLQSPDYIEGFLDGLEELEQGKMLDQFGKPLSLYREEKYPYGKAFLLDMGPKAALPYGWDGVKRLLPSPSKT
jgi:hypothetical protein